MVDPIGDIIGDCRTFAAQQRDRLLDRGILFEDFTHVKFYRLSLRASVELGAGPFEDGFHHVDGWVPQRLVTATGPNPLPRSTG
ncbi:hypothetical protein [Nocardioides pelophilus]|uniref:hypothetical protein n=1 Tax=Nocardioides pelophilus TaxID=2172019 RepID=UPI0016023AF7|nr:hypothetical protein [Nocardioides pelophilus]